MRRLLQPSHSRKMKLKTTTGDIDLPVVRLGSSQKSSRGAHLNDLATYLDTQHLKAKTEHANSWVKEYDGVDDFILKQVPINMLLALIASLKILKFDVRIDFFTKTN